MAHLGDAISSGNPREPSSIAEDVGGLPVHLWEGGEWVNKSNRKGKRGEFGTRERQGAGMWGTGQGGAGAAQQHSPACRFLHQRHLRPRGQEHGAQPGSQTAGLVEAALSLLLPETSSGALVSPPCWNPTGAFPARSPQTCPQVHCQHLRGDISLTCSVEAKTTCPSRLTSAVPHLRHPSGLPNFDQLGLGCPVATTLCSLLCKT